MPTHRCAQDSAAGSCARNRAPGTAREPNPDPIEREGMRGTWLRTRRFVAWFSLRGGQCERPTAAKCYDRPQRLSSKSVSANPGTAERHWRRRAAVAARELGLVGDSAMVDAIRKAGIGRVAAEMEVGLAGMADRPFANTVVEVEQPGLFGHFGARLSRNQAARRRGWDGRLLVARSLADEAARTDRAILHFGSRPMRPGGLCRVRSRSGRGRLRSGGLGPRFRRRGRRSGRGLLYFLLFARFDRRGALLETEPVRLA